MCVKNYNTVVYIIENEDRTFNNWWVSTKWYSSFTYL